MKWYSTKKYIPPDGDCVIRLQNKHNTNVFIFVVGHWHLSYQKWFFPAMESYDKNFYLEPTHFALIEPVEIEE